MSIPSYDKSENEDITVNINETSKKSFDDISKAYPYHTILSKGVDVAYTVGTRARELRMDPENFVEIYRAEDVASRTEGLVGPKGVADRLHELEFKEHLPKNQIVMQIAKEIAEGRFGKMPLQELAEQALRTALSVQTEGITAAPIEGISRVTIKPNPDGTQYLSVYYAGPIRSAGGTAQGVSILIADHIRKALNLSRYKATDAEIERMLEEVRAYNNIMHLQLPTSDEEIRHAWRNIPVMINGDPTEKEEVSGFRNIESMDTNRVRGGACLVLNDGVVGRAKKLMKRVKKLNLDGFEWLDEIASGKFSEFKVKKQEVAVEEEEELPTDYQVRYDATGDMSFLSDAIAGRPIFCGASQPGGFRLRYGHARNTGIAGIGAHPAVFAAVNDFIATGTHVRTERPGKGSIISPVDTIRSPIVLLTTGDVVELTSYAMAKDQEPLISKILFLGDFIIGYGEFVQNNYPLVPAGYCEEWWGQELLQKGYLEYLPKEEGILFYDELYRHPPDEQTALMIANKTNVPLHPKYTFAWKYVSAADVIELRNSVIAAEGNVLPHSVKPILEKILATHTTNRKNKLVTVDFMDALRAQLGVSKDISHELTHYPDGLYLVQHISDVPVRDVMGTTVGARMGRPEKSKARRLSPARHGLFPIGEVKGVNNNLRNAEEIQTIGVMLSNRYCETCKTATYEVFCSTCKNPTTLHGKCTNPRCGADMDEGPCDICASRVTHGKWTEISFSELINQAQHKIGEVPVSVKLIPRLKNPEYIVEILEKAMLRAKYDLHVFRDGTIRYDATDAPLTHFTPQEASITAAKAKELGYTTDIFGNDIVSDDQIIAIFPQDIIVNVSAKKHFMDVANFIDDLLIKVYDLPPFYNIQTADDVVGHLIIGLAPHTSAGVIGRIIGFTNATLCWAHPFWHSAKRRNCDGDEDGIILLLDGFLNFSKKYLPSTRGSKMDAPLVLVTRLNPLEVDDEAFNLDATTHYPVEFYEATLQGEKPSNFTKKIARIEDYLGTDYQFKHIPYTHSTTAAFDGAVQTSYKTIPSMKEKLDAQMKLAEIIDAIDAKFVATQVLNKHFIPDLVGNLRAFSSQGVYCSACKTKYRRVPLTGRCRNPKCPAPDSLRIKVYAASVSKYLAYSQELIDKYELGTYMQDRLDRIKEGIYGLFPNQIKKKELNLTDFLG